MADYNLILPSALPEAASAATDGAIPIDNGSAVNKVTPKKIVDAGRPFATQAQAEAGTDATVAMSPLTTKQAIEAVVPAVVQPYFELAEAWAESPTPPNPGVPTSKSSKTWAGEAASSATAASGFAADASSSASDAQDSADAAANSASSILSQPIVRYDAQTLTAPQQAQARANIGVTSQAQAVWDSGVSTTESLISPAKLAQVIADSSSGALTYDYTVTTAQTSFDIVDIPAWTNRLTVTVYTPVPSPSSDYMVVLEMGDASGFRTSGYILDGFSDPNIIMTESTTVYATVERTFATFYRISGAWLFEQVGVGWEDLDPYASAHTGSSPDDLSGLSRLRFKGMNPTSGTPRNIPIGTKVTVRMEQ